MDPEKINEFKENGFVVIEDVFSYEEISDIRNKFHTELKSYGIDHDILLSGDISSIENDGIRNKSAMANIFYSDWKMAAMCDVRVYNLSKSLMLNTFGSNEEDYKHPFEQFDDVLPLIDRICYRLPDSIRKEGGLGMHIDRNPTNPYLYDSNKNTHLKKWRPIQSLICLTDHFDAQSGGLKVVKGFHKYCDEYFSKTPTDYGFGEFHRLKSKGHTALERKLEFVYAPRGSVVYFDNRLAHATCDIHIGSNGIVDTREVIYFSYVPNIGLNLNYCNAQTINMKKNLPPPMFL